METAVVGLALVIVVLGGVLAFVLWKSSRPREGSSEGLALLLQQVNELSRVMDTKVGDLNRTMDTKLGETGKLLHESTKTQFGESQRLIDQFIKRVTEMTEKVTRVEETGKQMVNFASELRDLQDILKNPKQRGVLGEYYLETLLKNILPPGSYQMQYPFRDGTIVDAVVFVKEKIIPIDSKFSLENYNRLVGERDPAEKERLEKLFVNDLKMRIQETAKYVQPEQGTMDFAFMFIPHEAIYYDLLINKIGAVTEETENLIERAARKYKVIIISPTSFLAYLQTVLQGLKALQIEETAKDIIKRVEELGRHLKSYEDYHGKMGSALSTVVNHFNASSKEFKKVDKDVLKITGEAVGTDIAILDKPDLDV